MLGMINNTTHLIYFYIKLALKIITFNFPWGGHLYDVIEYPWEAMQM